MARLDAEERIARSRSRDHEPHSRGDRRLRPLAAPSLGGIGPVGQQTLVTAIFARLDVLGFQRLEYELGTNAVDLGLDAALPPVLDLGARL